MAAYTAYADFTYYNATYLGTAIDSSIFPRLALHASRVIDNLTFNRAAAYITDDTDEDTIDLIQMATCAVADELYNEELNGGQDAIASEKVGQYMVTYSGNARAMMSNEQRQEAAARLYLGQSGLMYRGFLSEE
jgi:hypothetical protein